MKKIGIAILALGLAGCSVGTSKPNHSTAMEVVRKLTYIQDVKTGLCYAVISTSHATSVSDDGLSITWVPCEPRVLEQIGK